MSKWVSSVAPILTVALCASCSEDVAPPEILRFESNLSAVATGRPVQLTWETRNTERIDIIAQPDTLVLDGSTDSTGRVVSPPIERTTVFRLEATGNGETVSASVRVTALGANDAVRISSFTVDPSAIRPGESATLEWRTAGATSGTLRTTDGVILSATPGLPNGTFEVSPDNTTDYELELVGSGGIVTANARLTVLRPEVRSFSVTPETIQRGESAVLSWAVAQATEVRVEDESGAVVVDGASLAGQAPVSPMATTTYRLVASDGSETVEATSTLTVIEPLQAEVLQFDASPASVRIGETSTLTWEVRNASRGVQILAGPDVIAETQAAQGQVVVRPASTTEFRLVARSLGGDGVASATVIVQPSPPAVLAFRAVPDPAVIGEQARLEWNVLGADTLSLARGGNVLADDLESTGSFVVDVGSGSQDYRLVADNADGTTARDLTLAALARPEISSFRSSPRSFVTAPVRVTLNWSTQNATELALTANNVAVPGFPPPGYNPALGQFEIDVTQTTLFELSAINAAATTREQIIVGESAGEQEPNDSPSTAGVLATGGQIRGEIDASNDVDWYQVTVPPGGNLRVETSDGNQSCATDTRIRVFGDSDRTVPIIDRDDGGAGACALIDPVADPRAADLVDSPYFIEVSANGGLGTYVLDVSTGAATCGNGIRERSNQEQCDDGPSGSPNCDINCLRVFTPIFTVGANGNGALQSAISPIGEREYVTVEVPAAGGFITARTWADRSGVCTAGTELVLFDANFDEVGRAVGSTFDNCAAIHPERQSFAAGPTGQGLAGGTYHLEVGDAGDDESIPQYLIEVASEARGCGNAIVEPSESCDDGNTSSGDGCSATCAFEGTEEQEPNDARATSTPIVLGPDDRATLQGRLSAGDIDFFELTVPNRPNALTLTATVSDGRGGCQAWSGGTDATIAVLDAAGTSTLASDQNRTRSSCAAALPISQTGLRSLPAGTYYVRVAPGAFAVDGRYAVELGLTPPVCGNAIRESGEQCDDGNQSTLDGCDATCDLELAETINLAQTSTGSWSATIAPETFSVAELRNLSANPRLVVDVFDAGTTTCANDWAAVLLLDDAFEPATALFSRGPGQCNPLPANLSLPAGTYYLVVLNIDGPGPESFDIEVELLP